MKRLLPLLFVLLITCNPLFASQVTIPTVWNTGDSVTASKLNGINNAFAAVLNGGIDSTNLSTGYSLFRVVSALPSPGNQGAVDFLTSNNTLNIDTGAAWVATITPSGTLATGNIPYYNGGWQQLVAGAQYLSLVSNGASSLPSYQQIDLTHGVTSTLPIANGGTGQTTQQTALDALLPSQSGKTNYSLISDGTHGNWTYVSPLQFVSSTSFSSATNSGDITIDGTKQYLVIVKLTAMSGSDNLSLRFNNDSTAAHYAYVYNGYNATSATAINGHSASATSAQITDNAIQAGSGTDFDAQFYIYPQGTSSTKNSNFQGRCSSAVTPKYTDFYGTWIGTATASSFRLLTTAGVQTITGTVYLYVIPTS